MLKNFLFNIFLFLFSLPGFLFGQLSNFSVTKVDSAHHFFQIDSLFFKVVEYKQKDLPAYYQSSIHTEVCYTGKCLPATINMHWNRIGQYSYFSFEEGDILTKNDHVPFTDADYVKLDEILHNKESRLAGLEPHMVTEDVDIDAYSNATNVDLRQEVVDGAAFTTYTLWHIANGVLQDSIEKITIGQINDLFLNQLLQSANIEEVHWGIEYLVNKPEETKNIAFQLIKILPQLEYYYSGRCLKALENINLSDNIQVALLQVYPQVKYEAKLQILQLFKSRETISSQSIQQLVYLLEIEADVPTNIILQILSSQYELPNTAYSVLAKIMLQRQAYIAKKAYQILKNCNVMDKNIQRKLKKYERSLN